MIILRQKHFGLIGKLAGKLQDKLDDKYDNLIKSYDEAARTKKNKEEKRLSRKLIGYIKNNGVDVINEEKGENFAMDPRNNIDLKPFDEDIKNKSSIIQRRSEYLNNYKKSPLYKDDIRNLKTSIRQRRAINSGKGYINVHVDKTPLGVIGHEGFHILGKKKFNIGHNKSDKANNIYRTYPVSRFDALKKSLQIGYNYIPEIREEAKASRGSIRWLKQNRASKQIVKSERRRLKNALGSYITENLRRSVQPIAYYKDRSIIKDTKDKLAQPINPVATINQGRAINTVYGRGGKF